MPPGPSRNVHAEGDAPGQATSSQHKLMTARLAARMRDVKSPEALWEAYKVVYKDHPLWLAAIKGYFVK